MIYPKPVAEIEPECSKSRKWFILPELTSKLRKEQLAFQKSTDLRGICAISTKQIEDIL
jgi:hypothetical protein